MPLNINTSEGSLEPIYRRPFSNDYKVHQNPANATVFPQVRDLVSLEKESHCLTGLAIAYIFSAFRISHVFGVQGEI